MESRTRALILASLAVATLAIGTSVASTGSAATAATPTAAATPEAVRPNLDAADGHAARVGLPGHATSVSIGTQFSGTLTPHETHSWFTYGWSPDQFVVWTVIPTSPLPGTPSVEWKVQIERATATTVSYWISVTNLTDYGVAFDGRYAILS
jgi:hypothetical protein